MQVAKPMGLGPAAGPQVAVPRPPLRTGQISKEARPRPSTRHQAWSLLRTPPRMECSTAPPSAARRLCRGLPTLLPPCWRWHLGLRRGTGSRSSCSAPPRCLTRPWRTRSASSARCKRAFRFLRGVFLFPSGASRAPPGARSLSSALLQTTGLRHLLQTAGLSGRSASWCFR
ncbi:hypothetical protein T484DRAFT_1948442 [Baffinella frigidus]|nr:hypothetical protein T484DRAFT_1948442 [Cryptophyta sp. CCMP2293]